jgi:subtilase family serine protease
MALTAFTLAGFGCVRPVLAQSGLAQSMSLLQARAAPQISGAINPLVRQTLPREVPAVVAGGIDQGPVPDGLALQHMILVLKPSAAQQQSLTTLTTAQQTPGSPLYHHWLTVAPYRRAFAPSAADIGRLTSWLTQEGFTVNAVAAGGLSIDFSGNAGQVASSFGTSIHSLSLRGTTHISNIGDPSIPAALAPVVAGIASLNDLRPHPLVRPVGMVRHTPGAGWKLQGPAPAARSAPKPNLTFINNSALELDVTPGDYATIYNINPLRSSATPLTGAGVTVAVVENSDMQPVDWATFLGAFGLSGSGTLTQTHPGGCSDPGTTGDEIEAALDAEWVSAVAPSAAVTLASCADSATTDGVTLALTAELNSAAPPAVISVSYGGCEVDYGASFLLNWSQLMQQAAVQGISVFVGSGDSASATCDRGQKAASNGPAVNGLATTAYAVAIGGTDFADTLTGTSASYWSDTNGNGGISALSYIPEMPWDDSCANSLLAGAAGYSTRLAFCNSAAGQGFYNTNGGGGGASLVTAKPSWQDPAITGVISDGVRDIPDVSMFAADGRFNHALLFCMSDPVQGGSPCTYDSAGDIVALSAGGTSFAAPAFAGIMALIDQKYQAALGNPAPRLYAIAASEYNDPATLSICNSSLGAGINGGCVFNNVTNGDNDVPCLPDTPSCYITDLSQPVGVLRANDQPAYLAQPGWSAAAGLGSVNVTNLVAGY